MYKRIICNCILVLVISVITEAYSFGADSTKSVVLKRSVSERIPFRFQIDNSDEVLWDAFMTMKKANSGDPIAQHALGLRYLAGRDFKSDTAKAAYWIGKAAGQRMITAKYNYGLLLNNGWGVEWNPFQAYKHFEYAAKHGMTEAEYVFGLMQTDNLVVQRNYNEAYRWIKMSADSGFVPAKEILKEFADRGILKKIDLNGIQTKSKKPASRTGTTYKSASSLRPIFLDFDADSIQTPDDKTLLKDVQSVLNYQSKKDADYREPVTTPEEFDSNAVKYFYNAAEAGSPEALTMMGRLYEQGIGVDIDTLKASVYYIRAIRFDSPWSPMLLWNITRADNYFPYLRYFIDQGNPVAKYVWSGLIDLGFDHQLTEEQALALLQDAVEQNYKEAIVQLGVCYYTNHWVNRDKEKAVQLFIRAEQSGSLDAKVRLLAIGLKDEGDDKNKNDLVNKLKQFTDNGSVLAEASLGYCYEKGIGVQQNKAMAISFYRHAAERGSHAAYDALRKLYDDLRPDLPEFQIEE